MSSPRPEKRKTPRIAPYVASCAILVGDRRLSGYLTDLSPRGARVVCDEAPPRHGTHVVLEVRFRRAVTRYRLPGEVKWGKQGAGRAGSSVFGLTFRGMPPDAQGILEAVVEEFRRRAAELEGRPGAGEGEGAPSRRRPWREGPVPHDAWQSLSDDELLYRIEAAAEDLCDDQVLIQVVRSDRHFFIRQEAAKRIGNPDLLKDHAQDRHIGQILVRAMTRSEDIQYLQRLIAETRHLEVRKAAEAQLRVIDRKKERG